jgi:glutamate-ammonia-ligase adenylyltransferase
VKLRAGGQIEVEFIAQVLQLIHARDAPELCSTTTRIALERLAGEGKLAADDVSLLIQADHLWRTIQDMLRITVGRGARDALPDASAQALLRAVNSAVDLEGLRTTMESTAQRVRAAFVKYIGEIPA